MATTNAGLFDLAEYRRVSYDASIGENFLWFAPELDLRHVTTKNIDEFEKKIVDNIPDESRSNYMFVTSKGGQKFACSLPDVEELKKPKSSGSSKNPKVYGDALAASFYVDKCIKLRGNHWWGYILCRGQTVEQVHGEPGQEGYVKNILGLFDGSLTMPTYQESTEDRLLYVEESYSSGTFCDLETYREPRSTTVRYECDPQLSTNEAFVSSVAEVKPCQYLMIVKVGTLCHFPEFLPASQANTKNIGCQPYFSRNEIREMLERQLDEKLKKAEAKRQVALAREEFHSALERYTAMSKSVITIHNEDKMRKTNAEMDYNAAHFNLLVSSLEVEGEQLTRSKLDSMWKLFTTTDIGDYMFYADYNSIEDENRAHLWYYFNDPMWPKDQFPKDILYVAIRNAYISEMGTNLQSGYDYEDDRRTMVEGIAELLKTGHIDIEKNGVISARDVSNEIVSMMEEFTDLRYTWLAALRLAFLNERGEFMVSAKILDSIRYAPKDTNYFPMGSISESLLSLVLENVLTDLTEIGRRGSNSDLVDPDSHRYTSIYSGFQIVLPEMPQDKKLSPKLTYKLKDEASAESDMEVEYLHILAPVYQLLSISWSHRKNPDYFNINPVFRPDLHKTASEDYKFHKNLARDMAHFARILTNSTLRIIEDLEAWRIGKVKGLTTVEALKSYFKRNPVEIPDDMIELGESILFEDIGPEMVLMAKKRIWKRKLARYETNYRIKDHKLRVQAKSMQGLMKDLLSVVDDSSAFVSLGGKTGASKKKANIIDEEFLSKLTKLDSLEDLDVEALKDFKDRLTATLTAEDDFFEYDEMQDVLDLLEKAGLSKKADIQIKMFDEHGNEIKNDELAAVAKGLFDSADAADDFKELEKAYNKKHLKDEEDEE